MSKRKPAAGQKPPAHLQSPTRKWFAEVVETFDLESHHLRLLTLAGESWDRCVAAREVLDREGLTFTDRFAAPHARPEIAIERDSRVSFARLIRELDLDVAPPAPNARPPSLRSNRRS